jgi:UDP-N-acetylglucosamine 2-epimerase (non-hydrolysing)
MRARRLTVLTLFGTRPEVIKLAPVITALEARPQTFRTVNVTSAQHTDLLYPFVRLLGVRVDHDLAVMRPRQPLNALCARVLARLDRLLDEARPDAILVQGDTTTAMAGALAGFHRGIPVGHVEAGLRSGDAASPYPEEMNRRLVSRLAAWHFAATRGNRDTLVAEGVPADTVFVTGNPVVDSLHAILAAETVPPRVAALLAATEGRRRIVLTTHRRESFGRLLRDNLDVLRRFVTRRPDVALLFPVHPNPEVRGPATEILGGHPRILLVSPLAYDEFVVLLSRAWLVVSDSGGVQEEAPTLGKPLLVLRANTERPEAVDAGVARLVGGRPARLARMLEEAYRDEAWIDKVGRVENPFGRGDAGLRIAEILARVLRR